MQIELTLKADALTQPLLMMWKNILSKENLRALESIKGVIETEEREREPFEIQRWGTTADGCKIS
jgi:hypothetical protein